MLLQLHSTINCSSVDEAHALVDVAYTRADGKHDSLHYISSVLGVPTVFVAQTSLSAALDIDCEKFSQRKPNSITFSHEPEYMYGVSFTKVCSVSTHSVIFCVRNLIAIVKPCCLYR